MEDFEKYSIWIDNINPGDFEVKIRKNWGLTNAKVEDSEKEEVFLFYLNKILESNPGIKNKLFKEDNKVRESQVGSLETKEEGCGDEDCCHSNKMEE